VVHTKCNQLSRMRQTSIHDMKSMLHGYWAVSEFSSLGSRENRVVRMEAVVWRKVRRVGYEEKLREYP
jgi:hypothetical protein